MLEKDTNTTDKYTLNGRTKLIVKNTRIENDRGETHYRTQVTLKHNVSQDKPLVFGSSDEIADFVNNIDMEDKQLGLPGMEGRWMSGTPKGGLKTKATIIALYGSDHYAKIGAISGKAHVPKGFALSGKQHEAGAKGGAISNRTGILNGQGKNRKRPNKWIE
jgi:hypothetical protein